MFNDSPNRVVLTTTLIVWEEVPDDTKLYVIPNSVITDEMRQHFRNANGHLINVAEDISEETKAGLDYLNENLSSYTNDEKLEPGSLAKYLVDKVNPIEEHIITAVYYSGFVL